MSNNDLAVRATQPATSLAPVMSKVELDNVLNIGRVLAASGFFADAKDEAQCAVKILAGLEYGFSPITAMKSFHVITIGGKPILEMTSVAKAGVIKRSGTYTYRIREHDETKCSIETYEKDPLTGEFESLGITTYTVEMAKKAGLVAKNDVWTKYPEDMVFARTVSRIAKRHTPELFGQDQLRTEADEDEAAGRVIKAASEAPATLPTRDTTTLPAGDLKPEIERRKRRVHVLARDLGWDDDTRHRETAKLFDGRMSVNDLDMDEMGQLIEAMATRVAGLTTLSEPKPPLATAQDNPLADVHMGPELSAYDRLARDIEKADPPATHRGDAAGITAQQTGRLMEIATAAGIGALEMEALAQHWSGGLVLQELDKEDVNSFGLAVKSAIGGAA